METKGRAAVEDGPTHERVAVNIRETRKRRGLQLGQLSERLTDVGRPMGASALSKIEAGNRRVTVDDLAALALALDVSPTFLLAPTGEEEHAGITPTVSGATADVLAWVAGERPLPGTDRDGRTRWAATQPMRSHRELRRRVLAYWALDRAYVKLMMQASRTLDDRASGDEQAALRLLRGSVADAVMAIHEHLSEMLAEGVPVPSLHPKIVDDMGGMGLDLSGVTAADEGD